MPGTNAGTGHPLTFRCAVCKVGRAFDSLARRDLEKGTNVVATGERRERPTGKGSSRRTDPVYQYSYKCLDCGHEGWSRHTDVRAKYLRGKASGIFPKKWQRLDEDQTASP